MIGNPYSVVSIPEQQRYFTTKEVSEMAEIGFYTVREICKRCGIDYEVRPIRNGRGAFYSWVDTQRIIEEANKNRRVKKKCEPVVVVTDEEKENHPLVTDLRCLKLSWWPETKPKCFEDLN